MSEYVHVAPVAPVAPSRDRWTVEDYIEWLERPRKLALIWSVNSFTNEKSKRKFYTGYVCLSDNIEETHTHISDAPTLIKTLDRLVCTIIGKGWDE